MGKILVTADYCGGCAAAKIMLKKRGIKFKAIDVDSNEGKKLDKKHHFQHVPVMVINGKKVTDPNKWFV